MTHDRRSFSSAMTSVTPAAIILASVLAARSLLRRRNRCDLRGKVVAITGGSRGFGLVMARQFVELGAKVAICARAPAELARARVDLEARGGRVLATTCDVTDRDALLLWLAQVHDELGAIDVLVNNAGVMDVGPMEHMTAETYERAMAIHFWAPLHAILAVLPQMRERGEGRVVNIASIGGKLAVPHLLPYTASKFALVGFSEGMRAELVKDNILVTTAVPGLMRTGSPPNATFKGHHRAEYAWFAISDSLPGLSMSAERTARKVIDAMRRGDPEVVTSLPAKLALTLCALAPSWTQRVLALVNRLLPSPGGVGTEGERGRDSQSGITATWLTSWTERSARRNNEIA